MKKLFKKNETYIFLVLVVSTLLIEAVSGQFYTANNLVNIARMFIPNALFSIGLMVVLISGGIDLSFPSIASLSSYIIMLISQRYGGEGNVVLGYLGVMAMGALLGAINGFFVAKYHFPAMIVTLATTNVFTGIMQGILRSRELFFQPNFLELGKSNLFVVQNRAQGLSASMPTTVLFVFIFALAAYFLLHHTMLGRAIYAIGGDIQSARRAGFNVPATQIFVFCFAGMMAGFSGMTRHIMNLFLVPTSLIGTETDIIAGVVLGGVRITGGVGTLTGAFLGILLLTVVRNSLLLLNVPTYWQTMVTALFIIIGTGVSSVQIIMARRHSAVNTERGV